MKIGIDARFYGGQYAKGLGRYCEKLIQHLENVDHENDYVIFLRRENWDAYQPKNPRFSKVLADVQWYTLAEQTKLPRIFSRAKLDLLHVPHFNVPVFYRGDFVVTVHDLIILHYPTRRASTLGPLLYWVKQTAYRFVIRRAVKRAKHIFAVSKFTKQDLVSYFHLSTEKVSVTYEAVEPLSAQADERVLQKNRIASPYLLYVGNAYPHKNVEGLVRAFAEVRKKNPQLQLVLVGKLDYFYNRVRLLAKSVVGGQEAVVIFPGRVTDSELAALYAHAALFVFPSHYEGFGFPPLEAMQQGVPVLASRESCLPEVLGDAAMYFDSGDPVDFVDKLNAGILLGEAEKAALVEKGFAQVKMFSWEECARRTAEKYNELKIHN